MQKRLSLYQLFGDVFHFIKDNFPLLLVLAFFSFAGSYLFNTVAYYFNPTNTYCRGFLMFLYAVYIYFYYYFFIALYFEQRPLFTKDKFFESFQKFIKILSFSFCVLLLAHIGFYFLRHLARGFIVFPEIYLFLQQTYHFVLNNPYTRFGLFFGSLFVLTFSFFIPSFSWVSTINGKDNFTITAYENVSGNYLKTTLAIIIVYGILPLFISLLGLFLGRATLSALYAALTILQIVSYLKLYDYFYAK